MATGRQAARARSTNPDRTPRGARWLLLAIVLATAGIAPGSPALGATPARVGPPSSLSALGDSITRGLNSGFFVGVEYSQNSFTAGDSDEVNSHYRRLLSINPAISGKSQNRAESGDRVADLNAKAQTAVTDGAEYVPILIGANDACRPTEADMTSVSAFRTRFQTAMNTLSSGLPDARIYVVSIPDIYRLWQVGKDNSSARSRWSLYNVCESMLANPQSTAPEDEARRQRVRQRVIDFNTQLGEVCAQFLRCRFDGSAAFFTQFDLSDLSAHDYFHPNVAGQTRAAEVTYATGFNYADRTAPVTTIAPARAPDGAGGWYRDDVSVALSATDGGTASGVRGHEYRLAGASGSTGWTRYTTPFPISAAGTTTVEARSVDVNGNVGASKEMEIRIDGTKPGLALTVPAPAGRDGSHTSVPVITGVTASDNRGLTGLTCSIDGTSTTLENDSGGSTSRTAEVRVSGEGPHAIECRAEDVAGNLRTASANFTIDTIPAVASVVSAPASPTNDPTATLAFSSESGASFECRVDGTDFEPCTSPYTTASLADGEHTFEVRATDRAGNLGPPASATFKVDTAAPPVPELTSTPSSPSNDRTPSFAFSGPEGFRCAVVAAATQTTPEAWGPCSGPGDTHTTSDLPDGRHRFEVEAVDPAGNRSAAVAYSFTVDTAAPETAIDSGPAALGTNRRPAITFSSEPGATFVCRLYPSTGATPILGACSGPGDTHRPAGELPDGTYTFEVAATDQAGNLDATPAARTFTVASDRDADGFPDPGDGCPGEAGPGPSGCPRVDRDADGVADADDRCPQERGGATDGCPVPEQAPDTRVEGGPQGVTANRSPRFVFNATSEGMRFECRVDSAAFVVCASPFTTEPLLEGPHRFEVRAVAPGGTADESPAVREFTVDTRPPVITDARLERSVFRATGAARGRPAAARTPAGTLLRYRLSETALVAVTIERLVPGRRSGARCVRPSRQNRRARTCLRRISRGGLAAGARPGANSLRLTGRVGGRSLAPGRYAATITAVDAAGNPSRRVGLSFRIVRG